MKKALSTLRGTTSGAALVEYGLLVGLIAVVAIGAVSGLGRQIDTSFDATTTALAGAVGEAPAGATLTGASCQDIYDQGGRADGIYTITTGAGDIRAACHFEDSGPLAGGWTVVAAQFEATPVGWNDGITADRPDAGYLDTGFSMSQAQLPTHSAMAVGRVSSDTMEVLDAVARTYSSGNVSYSNVPGLVSGAIYDVHRSDGGYYNFHDPEVGFLGNDPGWNNTLTFDHRAPGDGDYTWAFSAQQGSSIARGYAYDGASLEASVETFGWLIFVR